MDSIYLARTKAECLPHALPQKTPGNNLAGSCHTRKTFFPKKVFQACLQSSPRDSCVGLAMCVEWTMGASPRTSCMVSLLQERDKPDAPPYYSRPPAATHEGLRPKPG